MNKLLASTLIAATVIGGGAAAASAQDDPGPGAGSGSGTAATASAPARPHHHRHALRRRTVHGDLTVKTKDGFQQIAVDRGKLTSVEGSTLTVTRPDGPVVTVTFNDQTRYRGVDSAAELQTGKPVVVVSKDGVAKGVAQRP
jgi:hypothetical protein